VLDSPAVLSVVRGDDAWRRLLDSLDQTMDRVVERIGDGL